MKKKFFTGIIAGALVAAMCVGFAACGGAEGTLKGVQATTATKIVQTRGDSDATETRVLDGDKVQYVSVKYKNDSSGNRYVDTYLEYLFYKEGDTVKLAIKKNDPKTWMPKESSEYEYFLENGEYVEGTDDEFKTAYSSRTVKEVYESYRSEFEISGEKLGDTLDSAKEYYAEKGGKLLSEKQEDGTVKIQFQALLAGRGILVPIYTWGVKDKKLVYRVNHVLGDNYTQYNYSYDAETITVPTKITPATPAKED